MLSMDVVHQAQLSGGTSGLGNNSFEIASEDSYFVGAALFGNLGNSESSLRGFDSTMGTGPATNPSKFISFQTRHEFLYFYIKLSI